MLNKISCSVFCPTSSASEVCVQNCTDIVKCLLSFLDIISVAEENNSYLYHESLKKTKIVSGKDSFPRYQIPGSTIPLLSEKREKEEGKKK